MRKTRTQIARRTPKAHDLLSVEQAAQILERKPMTVRRLIRAGKLQAVLITHHVKVLKASVEAYMRPRPYKPQDMGPKRGQTKNEGHQAAAESDQVGAPA